MPRIRSVHPDICEDPTLAEVSAYAERTFVRLWTYLDDEGRAKADTKLLKSRLYPLHDSMTIERVEKDLDELVAKGLLQRYEVDGQWYVSAKSDAWRRWQHPQRPTASKLPAPSASTQRGVIEASASTHAVVEGSGVEKEGQLARKPRGVLDAYRDARDVIAEHTVPPDQVAPMPAELKRQARLA